MNRAFPGMVGALRQMLDAIDGNIRSSGYSGEPIDMYLAGGLAVNYYCGTRFTQDVDASFSKRILLPVSEMVFEYAKPGGQTATLYLDGQYNTSYAVLHKDFELDAQEWEGIGNEQRILRLKVLAPVDLATSKLLRFLDHDQSDILALAAEGLIDSERLRLRTNGALSYFVGNTNSVRTSLDLMCKKMDALVPPQVPVPRERPPSG